MRTSIGSVGYASRAPILMALLTISSLVGGAAERPSVSDIDAAWRARQQRIKSATFTWEETNFIAARSVPPPSPSVSKKPRGRHVAFLPEKNITLHRSAELLISDNMMRHCYEGRVYNPNKGGIRRKRYVSVYDGTTAKNFHHLLDGDQTDFPLSGFIREERHWDFGHARILPVLMSCRPCDESMGGVDLQAYEMGDKIAEIDGSECYILQPRVVTKQPQRSYWVDPARDYVVLRITHSCAGAPPFRTIEVDYAQAGPREWVPSGWKLVDSPSGSGCITKQQSMKVTDCVLNAEIAKSAFQFEFPPDTAVFDHRTNGRHIARKNGGKRTVTQAELSRGATYPDLVATEPGEAAEVPKKQDQTLWYSLMGACTLVLVVSVAILLRRKRHKGT